MVSLLPLESNGPARKMQGQPKNTKSYRTIATKVVSRHSHRPDKRQAQPPDKSIRWRKAADDIGADLKSSSTSRRRSLLENKQRRQEDTATPQKLPAENPGAAMSTKN